jgi:hypothetical protein
MSNKAIHNPNKNQGKTSIYNKVSNKTNTIKPPINEAKKMIEELKESYDNFLYVSKAFSNTCISALMAKARIYGLDPVPVEDARVLELGSSCGGNIIPQALYNPTTTFTGIDLSPTQVKHGNELIESMGLKNITLLEKDIMDIDDSFGTFDYIIVHGIWSWVPDVVKDKILSICNRNLSDRGVAYVSYNTYPGWKRLEQLRDIMLYSEKHAANDSLQERTVYTKNVLKLIAETMKLDERSTKISDYKIKNINRVLQSNDYYVGHEYLEAINDPVYVSEFIERAQEQGCAYIGDETLNRSFITWLDSNVENNIRTLARDSYIDKEQYYDYVYDTQFRMALLTKCSNEDKISHDERVEKKVLDTLYFNNALDEEPGVPPEWTNVMHISIQELMDTKRPFNVADIMKHIEKHHPDSEIDTDAMYRRLFHLAIVGHINTYTKKYDQLPFEENKTYIPEHFINYVSTLVEKGGYQYMCLGNMYNQIDFSVNEGLSYIMKLMAKPISRKELIDTMNENLTIERTKADGTKQIVSSEQYLNESIAHIQSLGYFAK